MSGKKYFERKIYFNRIRPFINKNIVKVITGQLGVGKRYFLLQLIDFIKTSYPDGQVISISLELNDFRRISNHLELLEYINGQINTKKGKVFLFLDKIQNIKNYELAIGKLLDIGGYDIYITGSNKTFLTSLTSFLAGRYMNFQMNCLSYQEFLLCHGFQNNEASLMEYIKFGGLPFLKNLELAEELVYEYINGIYNSIILKEIVYRFQIRNVSQLDNLIAFLGDNLGNLVSAKKISDVLKAENLNYSPRVIINYLTYLTNSYFIHKVRRVNLQNRKIFEVNEKYYFEDLGLRHSIKQYSDDDISKVLENLVYKHLMFCGFEVSIGQLGKKEIDFCGEKKTKSIYVQVVNLIPDENTQQTEFGSLLSIKDNYPKYVVSMDPSAGDSYKGIHHMHILDFLTTEL